MPRFRGQVAKLFLLTTFLILILGIISLTDSVDPTNNNLHFPRGPVTLKPHHVQGGAESRQRRPSGPGAGVRRRPSVNTIRTQNLLVFPGATSDTSSGQGQDVTKTSRPIATSLQAPPPPFSFYQSEFDNNETTTIPANDTSSSIATATECNAFNQFQIQLNALSIFLSKILLKLSGVSLAIQTFFGVYSYAFSLIFGELPNLLVNVFGALNKQLSTTLQVAIVFMNMMDIANNLFSVNPGFLVGSAIDTVGLLIGQLLSGLGILTGFPDLVQNIFEALGLLGVLNRIYGCSS